MFFWFRGRFLISIRVFVPKCVVHFLTVRSTVLEVVFLVAKFMKGNLV